MTGKLAEGGFSMRMDRRLGAILALALLFVALMPVGAMMAEDSQQQRMEQSRNRFLLGRMYEQAGDLTRAEENYQLALDLWADNVDARVALQNLIDSRRPPVPVRPFWADWLAWLPMVSTGTYNSSILELIGWIAMTIVFVAVFLKLGTETIRLAVMRSKGIPLIGLGDFRDPFGRLPGLAHHVATQMNDAGLTVYDEKGAILPDFNFIGDTGFPQARLLTKLVELVYARQVQRISVEISIDGGMLNASVSLVDSANGYVRYLQVVSIDPRHYTGAGELTRIVAQLVSDAILIALSRDHNTRGLLFQRMGNWSLALKEFLTAAESSAKKGTCGIIYQAHLNLGNLYSFLGLQDKSVASYVEVAERAQNPTTLALIYAAMACSYKNWQFESPPDQQPTYDWLARQSLEKTLTSDHKTPLIYYTIACYYSLSGQIDECLRWLREAVAGDLAFLEYALSDPDMENLRKWLGGNSLGEALGLRVG